MAAPARRVSAAHSATVMPSVGASGTTSTAPIRGCGAALRPEVGCRQGPLGGRHHCLFDPGRVAGEREHGSVVRDVGGVIEQSRRPHGAPHGDLVDDVTTTSPADVGHAFDDGYGKYGNCRLQRSDWVRLQIELWIVGVSTRIPEICDAILCDLKSAISVL